MRRIYPGPVNGPSDGKTDGSLCVARARAAALVLATALPLAACGSDTAPPLTGNLVDARGAHAGRFRSADADPADANSTAGGTDATPANNQDTRR